MFSPSRCVHVFSVVVSTSNGKDWDMFLFRSKRYARCTKCSKGKVTFPIWWSRWAKTRAITHIFTQLKLFVFARLLSPSLIQNVWEIFFFSLSTPCMIHKKFGRWFHVAGFVCILRLNQSSDRCSSKIEVLRSLTCCLQRFWKSLGDVLLSVNTSCTMQELFER